MKVDSRADAHFLHARAPLESVLAVPVEAPRALSWVARKEMLLVAAADGTVMGVEPSFGSRTLFSGAPDPVQIASKGDTLLVLTAKGTVQRWMMGRSKPECTVETGLCGETSGVRFFRDGFAVVGHGGGYRRVRVYMGDALDRDHVVPEGAALGSSEDGALIMARSTEAEMRIAPLGQALPPGPPTGHSLRFTPGCRVLGVAPGGATVWFEGRSQNVRLLDTVAAALCHDGRTIALGTRGGVVALADIQGDPRHRGHPPRVDAHTEPLRVLSFSSRGRWLATAAENCRLWSY